MKPFNLSQRQRKDLTVRGAALRIAIPHPWYEIESNLLDWARDQIQVDDRQWIRSAEIAEITTTPNPSMEGAVGMFGQICHDTDQLDSDAITTQIVAVVVTIIGTKSPRHNTRTSWAAIVPRYQEDQPK